MRSIAVTVLLEVSRKVSDLLSYLGQLYSHLYTAYPQTSAYGSKSIRETLLLLPQTLDPRATPAYHLLTK